MQLLGKALSRLFRNLRRGPAPPVIFVILHERIGPMARLKTPALNLLSVRSFKQVAISRGLKPNELLNECFHEFIKKTA